MSYLAIRVVNRAITADQPDVIHLHTQSIALLAHRRPSGIPLVISLDATSALLAREMDSPGDLRPAIAAERRAFQGAAHIVAWTRWAAQSVVNDYGVEPERVTVVYPSVPFGPLLAIHLERDATGRKVRILFVGNDFERKGGFELLSAFHAHFKTRCELHIVSNQGPKNAGEGVFIHSGLSPMSPELVNLYRDADVFVLPTREDVCGLVFIEAMAAGLPMIGTNVMGVTEIVGDGQTGFLIPRQAPEVLRAALDRLVSNPALRAQMGTAGRARALADFQPAVNAERIGEIFKRVARSKG